MSSVLDLVITPALKKVGNVNPKVSEKNEALAALNAMIKSWSVEGLLVPYVTRENFALIVGQSSYTIGSAGNFNTTRPLEITGAYIRDTNNNDIPLNVHMTLSEYNSIGDKKADSRPTKLCYLKEYPLGKILFNYEPTDAETLYLDSLKVISSFALLTTEVSLSGEYEEALIFNLALRLAPDYDFKLDPLVIAIANNSLDAIYKQNLKPIESAMLDSALLYAHGKRFNILTGEYS